MLKLEPTAINVSVICSANTYFLIFYFLLIRPQQKRQKEHKILLESIKRNDEIMTSGGILGKVLKVDGDKLSVEIAKGVNVTVLRSTVADVINKK